ncbi:tetratricopeptide repeat protein [Hyphobacterium sp.]|uniref:tetratricopeptide repeat protein n=1 Tax=Hyphobacterium sp. TaxID=2004662 RepID=UPI003B521794
MSLRASLLAGLTGLAVCASAYAAEPVTFSVERIGNTARIVLAYPEAFANEQPTATAEVAGGQVVVVRMSDAIEGSPTNITGELEDLIALARIDPDGTALRLALRSGAFEPRVSASYNMVAIDLVPAGETPPARIVSPREQAEIEAAEAAANAPPPPPPPALPVTVSSGQAAEYTRLEFVWPEAVSYEIEQDGDAAQITFSEPAEMDLSQLRASPPRLMESIAGARTDTEFILDIAVEPGVSVRVWDEGARIVVDLLEPGVGNPTDVLSALTAMVEANTERNDAADSEDSSDIVEAATPDLPPETEAPADAPFAEVESAAVRIPEPEADDGALTFSLAERADPVPPNGIVHASVSETEGELQADFEWAGPVGAAVFRRGSAIWVVFDAEADLDLDEIAHGRRGHVIGYTATRGRGYTAARIVVPESTQAEVFAMGARWRLVLSERVESPPRPISVERDARRGASARILVRLDDIGETLWVDDPAVEDTLAVITSRGSIQGAPSRRDFVGMALLPSSHGAAMEILADDVVMSEQDGVVVFARPDGLVLSPTSDSVLASGRPSLDSPAYMDFARWRGEGRFWSEYTHLYRQAANGNSTDRIALTRFLLGNGLGAEALGMIDVAMDRDPAVQGDPHALALAGVASLTMGRIDDAHAAFSAPELRNDPGSAPWLAMIAAHREEWEEASRRFAASREFLFDYSPEWRARFRVKHAETALELNDIAAATELLRLVGQDNPDEITAARAEWLRARLAVANGNVADAMRQLEQLSHSGLPQIEALALLELYQIQIANELIVPDEAVEALEMLRLRWRGDTTELDTMTLLGQLYVREGQYSEGLEIMRTARAQFPDTRAARRTGQEMAEIFNDLFLEGAADRMDPIEAVALFYEHSYLTPIGSDGDRMIRRLADRLVAFDLLEPAAQLLAHQVNERLREPAARARVGTDLAVIYLMDHRPSEALTVIRSTRVAGLRSELVDERRILEARALSELGRHDHALELIERDTSERARRLRADVAWARRDWPDAGRRIEAALADRWNQGGNLTMDEQADVLRAAIAYNLAGDRDALARLTGRYGAMMAETDEADSFSVLTSRNATSGDTRIGDLARQIAGVDTLDAFMGRFRERFAEDPAADPA